MKLSFNESENEQAGINGVYGRNYAKEIALRRITLSDFKGIKEFTADFHKKCTVIRGANKTGKTTLFDAFLWCLFGKDSKGQKNFEIKTLDGNNKAIPHINHIVEIVLTVNGQEMLFSRNYREKWVKSRGSATAEMSGHETVYSVDGVPVSETEYRKEVSSIIDEETFRLLTSPSYFPSLDERKQRGILINLVGDISERKLAETEFAELAKTLGNRTAEEQKKVIASRKTKINEALRELPARIDELKRGSAPTRSPNEINRDGEKVQERIKELEAELKPDTRAETVRQKIKAYEWEKAEANRIAISEYRQTVAEAENRERAKQAEYTKALNELTARADKHTRDIKRHQDEIADLSSEKEKISAAFDALLATAAEVDEVCPVCGQELPAEKVTAALAKFNEHKAEQLQAYNKKGIAINRKLEELNTETERLTKELEGITADIDCLEKPVSDNTPPPAVTLWDKENDREYQDLQNELNGISLVSEDKIELNRLKLKLDELNREYFSSENAIKQKKRIAELEKEIKDLQKEYEALEQTLFEIERLMVRKVEMLNERIAEFFPNVRFKLFAEQINGGIAECCQILVDGVPYGKGLNNAAEINAGLEIIDALSKHYRVYAPVWSDNMESVDEVYRLNSQQILLYVDKNEPTLKITGGE
jgi:DNA repair exonuclease SbcCD ATPase subunit